VTSTCYKALFCSICAFIKPIEGDNILSVLTRGWEHLSPTHLTHTLCSLSAPFLDEPVLRASDGRVLQNGSELERGAPIWCEAASDPPAVISLTGRALQGVGEAECEEQEGGGWRCSSNATFSSKGGVKCGASQPELQTERCAGGDTCVYIFIQSNYVIHNSQIVG
jgi:hypothetical protein